MNIKNITKRRGRMTRGNIPEQMGEPAEVVDGQPMPANPPSLPGMFARANARARFQQPQEQEGEQPQGEQPQEQEGQQEGEHGGRRRHRARRTHRRKHASRHKHKSYRKRK